MKKFESIAKYYIRIFKRKVFRFPVGGFGNCPNRDPYTKEGGCIYCDIKGSASDFLSLNLDIEEQIKERIKENKNYILYFQPYTTTYCEEEFLINTIENAMENPKFLGISIGSRPDTISSKLWNYFEDLSKRKYFELEIGLQTSNERTLKFINRGHTLKEFEDCLRKAEKLNIKTIIHIIIGLPGEGIEDYINTANYLNSFKINGIKIHPLHIMKSSKLAKIYGIEKELEGGEIFEKEGLPLLKILTLEDYKEIIYQFLLSLNENLILYRITSERHTEDFLGPIWLLQKGKILKEIKDYLKERDIIIL